MERTEDHSFLSGAIPLDDFVNRWCSWHAFAHGLLDGSAPQVVAFGGRYWVPKDSAAAWRLMRTQRAQMAVEAACPQ